MVFQKQAAAFQGRNGAGMIADQLGRLVQEAVIIDRARYLARHRRAWGGQGIGRGSGHQFAKGQRDIAHAIHGGDARALGFSRIVWAITCGSRVTLR